MRPLTIPKLILLHGLALLLLACGASAPPPETVEISDLSSGLQGDLIERQLQLAQRSSSPQQDVHLLNAAELMLLAGDVDDARLTLERVQAVLPEELQLRRALLLSDVALRMESPDQALNLLQQAVPDEAAGLDESVQRRILELRARAYYEQNRYIAAVRERLSLTPLLPQSERAANMDIIWQILSNAPASTIEIRGSEVDSYELRGWLELAQVVRANQNDIARQISAVDQWRSKWIQHSAAAALPESLSYVHQLWNNRARRIALLIPMDEAAGKAVSEGFFAAWYEALDSEQEVPEISVYDTTNITDIMPIYRQAVSEGADLVIGPLRKDSVRQLQALPELPVPTLALNYGDAGRPAPAGFYQFGLAPEDEIMQAADMAWAAGHRQAAVLIPRGPDYARIRDVFTSYWLGLGGEIVSETRFGSDGQYSDVVRELLSIEASEARAARLRSLLSRNTIHFTPRRRQDVDFIFLLASPSEGRQIKPSLAFHFAGDIPVYAMPGIYDGGLNEVANRDLNGVQFTDAPWLLRSNALRDSLNAVLPAAASNVQRLRAMGVDSFRLYTRLEQLALFPRMRIQGATGTLSMLEDGSIKRELLEARFVNGSASLMASRQRSISNALAPADALR